LTSYAAPDLAAFIQSLVPTKLGDLRAFLCARPGAKGRQLYTQNQLDLSLLAEQIEILRTQALTSLEHQSLDKRALQKARNHILELSDASIWRCYSNDWRGIPPSIIGWAITITDQLVTGSCDCPEAFAQTDTAYRNAHRRCRDYHFVCRENLDRASTCELYQQRNAITDPAEFVERAVIEKLLQVQHKNLAKTMLCNVFVTPGGNKLRLGRYPRAEGWADGLTETGRDEKVVQAISEDTEIQTPDLLCFGCPQCLSFIGDKGTYRNCVAERHFWFIGTVTPEDDIDGDYHKVTVKSCRSGHIWPAAIKGPCPLCGQDSVTRGESVEVFCPTNRNFDDVTNWRETLLR
jgi:hypothetical protein